jgi:membrane associated rhomboid family serine protease
MIPLRDENPSGLKPAVTVTFIVLCVLTFLWQLSYGRAQQAVIYAFALIPSVLFGYNELPPDLAVVPPSVTLLTSMFMHGGWMHLIGNMLYLWIFGDNVEDAMGHVKFVVFYLLCGIAAAFTQAIPDPHSTVPMLGASGAISGVLGAYLLLYPHARVLVAIPFGFVMRVMHLPAGIVLSLWFGLQFLSSLFAKGGGGVAFRAHIGGFVAGLLLVAVFKRKQFRLFNPLRRSDERTNIRGPR